jgi:hypothetical protein
LGTGSGIFNNGPGPGQWFWGMGGKGPLQGDDRLGLALYYLGLARPNAQFQAGTAHELRHTLGTRIFGTKDRFDYDVEFDFQFGRFGTENILAWMVAGHLGYTFAAAPMSPRLGLKGHSASGNRNPGSSILRTFNALFSKGGDFGDLNILSAANLSAVHPSLQIIPRTGRPRSIGTSSGNRARRTASTCSTINSCVRRTAVVRATLGANHALR